MPTLAPLVALALAASAGPFAVAPPSEPEGYWTGAPHGVTPTTLAGANVVDAAAVERLVAAQPAPVLLDVARADREPPGLAPGSPWLPTHRSLPGAVWLPGAGDAPLEPGREALFGARLRTLTQGDRERPIVGFCHADCWASWNAVKRLVALGYRHVYWFRAGVEGWREGHELAVTPKDPDWTAASQ